MSALLQGGGGAGAACPAEASEGRAKNGPDMDKKRVATSLPIQTGRADLPHPAFRSVALTMDWLRPRTKGTEIVLSAAQARAPLTGSPAAHCPTPTSPKAVLHRTDALSLAALRRWFVIRSGARMALLSYVPSLHGRYPLLRYYGRSDPDGPFPAVHRGSLIHATRISDHSVSNHLRFSTRRVPLPQRWRPYFVRGSRRRARGLAKTADRIEFACLCVSRRVTD
jgi:hypothetical protein